MDIFFPPPDLELQVIQLLFDARFEGRGRLVDLLLNLLLQRRFGTEVFPDRRDGDQDDEQDQDGKEPMRPLIGGERGCLSEKAACES